jgi:hypothetical protein
VAAERLASHAASQHTSQSHCTQAQSSTKRVKRLRATMSLSQRAPSQSTKGAPSKALAHKPSLQLRSTPAVAPRYTDTPHVAKLNGNTTLPEHLTRLILAYASAHHNSHPLYAPPTLLRA